MSTVINAEASWEVARLGKFTSSEIYKLLTEPKSKAEKEAGSLSQGSKTYIMSRFAELLTGQTRSLENIYAIQWGIDNEPYAIELLKKQFPLLEYYGTENKAFFELTDFSGGSPDAVEYNTKSVFEVKCPENATNHIEYLLMQSGDDLKSSCPDYYAQLQMNMVCFAKQVGCKFKDVTGYFVSYQPMVEDDNLKMKVLKVLPEEGFDTLLISKINKATRELITLKNILFT